MKTIIETLLLALFITMLMINQAHAETPWARDCVKWWGGEIPVEERTPENCPNKVSHWEYSGTAPAGGSYASTGGITQVNLPSGGYLVQRAGSTINVIQTSKSR